jgi:hypothetical protein
MTGGWRRLVTLVGAIADLVVLNANPLDDIHRSRDIAFVMKSGVLDDGNTHDERWPASTPYGDQPWRNEAGLRSDRRRLDYWDHH